MCFWCVLMCFGRVWCDVRVMAREGGVQRVSGLGVVRRIVLNKVRKPIPHSTTHQKHIKNTSKTHRKHIKNTSKTHQKHIKNTSKTHQKHIKNTSPIFSHSILSSFPFHHFFSFQHFPPPSHTHTYTRTPHLPSIKKRSKNRITVLYGLRRVTRKFTVNSLVVVVIKLKKLFLIATYSFETTFHFVILKNSSFFLSFSKVTQTQISQRTFKAEKTF